MRKIMLGLTAAAVIGAAAFFLTRPAAVAEEVTLYKNPECGCCEEYAAYLRQNGFSVAVKPTHDLSAMSQDVGIPPGFEGCHLSFIGDYVVSGHVPIGTVNKLLTERPDIKGVSLPGMPNGSPGMSGQKTERFEIYAVGQGRPKVYAVE